MIARISTETSKRVPFLLAVCAAIALAGGCDSSKIEHAGSAKAPDQENVVSGKVHRFTDANFSAQVLNNKGPVLVDFWATWCRPCLRLAPVIKQLARDYAGKVKVGNLDVDHNNKTATTYGIGAIPDVALFKNGAVVGRLKGLQPKSAYQNLINKHLK